jgi:hypothetical protein
MKTKVLVLMVLIIAIAAMAMPVMADSTGSTTITGDVSTDTSITASSTASITLNPAATGGITTTISTVTVANNAAAGYKVNVKDAMTDAAGSPTTKTATAGHMTATQADGVTFLEGQGTLLTDAMTASVTADDDISTSSPATLAQTDSTGFIASKPGHHITNGKEVTVTFSQKTYYTDTVITSPAQYLMVVTFTAGAQ